MVEVVARDVLVCVAVQDILEERVGGSRDYEISNALRQ